MTIALRQRPLARVVAGIVRANDGAIFDASDMSTMFQDAAGTTPVTSVGQPVGLHLDKSRGLQLGNEIVPDPTFSQWTDPSVPDGWIKTGTHNASNYVQESSSALRLVSDGTYIGVTTTSALTIGKTYRVKFDIVSSTMGSVAVLLGPGTDLIRSAPGSYSATIKATGTTIDVKRNAGSAVDIVVDNLSVSELPGYHASQSITASRPTLSARKNILLATEALATQSVTTLAAQYTLSFTGTGSVTLSGTATGTLTGTGANDRVSLTVTPTAGTLALTVSGGVTKAQLELGTSTGPYQRVNTATDYDTDERYFPKYLRFDGIDDYLVLPYMGLYANGSASVVAGLSTAAKGSPAAFIVSEGNNANDVANYLLLIHISRGVYSSSARSDTGVTQYSLTSSTISTNNQLNVVTMVDGGGGVNLFNNSTGIGAASYARSSATTLNTTTIGALDRLTDTGFIINNLYGLIITKSALTDSQRVACERYLGRKAGVIL